MSNQDAMLLALLEAQQQEDDADGGWYSTEELKDLWELSPAATAKLRNKLVKEGKLETAKRPRANYFGAHYMCPVVRLRVVAPAPD